MIDKKNTIILLDNDSYIGKVVRLIMDRNCDIRDGYDFHQHNKASTYFPDNNNDKKYLLVGDIFNIDFIKDIFNKDPEYKAIYFHNIPEEEFKPINILLKLWNQTSRDLAITKQEYIILEKVSKIFEDEDSEESKIMEYYINNFVNILTNGKDFFSKDFKEIEDTVKWYNEKKGLIQSKWSNKKFNKCNDLDITAVEQNFIDEKKFFEPNTYQIVLDFKGKDLEEVLLEFYKKYPDLKEHFNLIKEVDNGEDISSIMEQKLLLESLHLVNVEYYNKCIKKSNTENNTINQNILGSIVSIINTIRNRLVTRKHKK